MALDNYIKYLKWKHANKNMEDLGEVDSQRIYDFYHGGIKESVIDNRSINNDSHHINKVKIKSKSVVKKTVALSLVTVSLVGFLLGSNAIHYIISNKENIKDVNNLSTQTNQQGDAVNKYDYMLTEDEALLLAAKVLNDVECELTSVGAGTMGEIGTSFYPAWFNSKTVVAISCIESSLRTTEKDGSPLLGDQVKINGEIEQARGMTQVLPSTLKQINFWLKNTMGINKVYTEKDLDNPEIAMRIMVYILIMNTKNYFDSNEEIFDNLNLGENVNLQGQLVVASYKYGPGNIMKAYYDKTLNNTYLNENWKDGNNANYLNSFNENYNNLEFGMGR